MAVRASCVVRSARIGEPYPVSSVPRPHIAAPMPSAMLNQRARQTPTLLKILSGTVIKNRENRYMNEIVFFIGNI